MKKCHTVMTGIDQKRDDLCFVLIAKNTIPMFIVSMLSNISISTLHAQVAGSTMMF
jgi:hypothetical protein